MWLRETSQRKHNIFPCKKFIAKHNIYLELIAHTCIYNMIFHVLFFRTCEREKYANYNGFLGTQQTLNIYYSYVILCECEQEFNTFSFELWFRQNIVMYICIISLWIVKYSGTSLWYYILYTLPGTVWITHAYSNKLYVKICRTKNRKE